MYFTYLNNGDISELFKSRDNFIEYLKSSNYLEYDKSYVCSLDGACKTKIVLGCMDQNACNYDAKANKNLSTLCCYPGYCNNRDLTVVCPSILEENVDCQIYPNPVKDVFSINIENAKEFGTNFYTIQDITGTTVSTHKLEVSSKDYTKKVDVSTLPTGVYFVTVSLDNTVTTSKIVKQ